MKIKVFNYFHISLMKVVGNPFDQLNPQDQRSIII